MLKEEVGSERGTWIMKINQKSETATLEILYHNGKKTFAVKILGTRDALDVLEARLV